MAGYKNFRSIIVIVTTLALTFNAVILPAAALEVGSVNETGSVEYIEDDRSALEPAESEFAEKEENTQNDKKENIPQEGESGQEADAPSENAGDAVSTNQEEVDASFVGYCSVSERSQMYEAAMPALEMDDGWALVSSEEELRSALRSPEENINIKLCNSFPVVNAPLEIPKGKNVTMDLNGKTLTNNITNNSSENSEESLFKILTGGNAYYRRWDARHRRKQCPSGKNNKYRE